MNIKANLGAHDNCVFTNTDTGASAISGAGGKGSKVDNDGVDGSGTRYILNFDASRSGAWSGATSAGSSHTHTFTGGTASFGSGNYLRPNSTAILYCIKY